MFLRRAVFCTLLLSFAPATHAETVNLRNSCELWKHIPAKVIPELPVTAHIESTPITALLSCANENKVWNALKIMCFPKTAEIEYRYQSSYDIATPIPPNLQDEINLVENDTTQGDDPIESASFNNEIDQHTPKTPSLNAREMLTFDFRRVGITNVVSYDFDTNDWHYRLKEPRAQLFQRLIHGNYTDVTFLATGITERLPLRGSTKALRPVIETCRKARVQLDKQVAQQIQD